MEEEEEEEEEEVRFCLAPCVCRSGCIPYIGVIYRQALACPLWPTAHSANKKDVMSKVHTSQRITGFDLLVPSFACTYASFCAFAFPVIVVMQRANV